LSDAEAAKAAGVCRQTVSEWRTQPQFIAALNFERNKSARQIMQRLRARMSKMTEAALTGVSAAIKRGDAATARWWLDSIGLDAVAKATFDKAANPTLHPEEIDAVIDDLAAQRVDAFLTVKGVGALERLRLREALTAKEAVALREEFDKNDDAEV